MSPVSHSLALRFQGCSCGWTETTPTRMALRIPPHTTWQMVRVGRTNQENTAMQIKSLAHLPLSPIPSTARELSTLTVPNKLTYLAQIVWLLTQINSPSFYLAETREQQRSIGHVSTYNGNTWTMGAKTGHIQNIAYFNGWLYPGTEHTDSKDTTDFHLYQVTLDDQDNGNVWLDQNKVLSNGNGADNGTNPSQTRATWDTSPAN